MIKIWKIFEEFLGIFEIFVLRVYEVGKFGGLNQGQSI